MVRQAVREIETHQWCSPLEGELSTGFHTHIDRGLLVLYAPLDEVAEMTMFYRQLESILASR